MEDKNRPDKRNAASDERQDDVKGKIFRTSHMGYVDPLDTLGMIAAVEFTMAKLGADIPVGAGVAAAAKVLADWK